MMIISAVITPEPAWGGDLELLWRSWGFEPFFERSLKCSLQWGFRDIAIFFKIAVKVCDAALNNT